MAERTGRQPARALQAAQEPSATARPSKRVTSSSLFQGGRLLLIEHAGTEYRLQITSRGRLILTR